MNNMMKMVKLSFETGIKSMDTFQAQAEKAMEQTMKGASVAQGEALKSYDSWVENVKAARKAYVDAIEQGVSSVEQHINPNKK